MSSQPCIIVVCSHRMVAEAIASGLRSTGVNSAVCATMREAVRAVLEGSGRLVLVDAQLVTLDGMIREDDSATGSVGVPLVVLSSADSDKELASTAIRAGVRGWVSTDAPMHYLGEVIAGVLRDETWFPPALLTHVFRELTSVQRHAAHEEKLLASLTSREREVLSCLSAGMSRQAIAVQLVLSACTVRTHVQNILAKLDVHSAVAAVAMARRAGHQRTLAEIA